jgi:molybdate transport system substrate-binding protein
LPVTRPGEAPGPDPNPLYSSAMPSNFATTLGRLLSPLVLALACVFPARADGVLRVAAAADLATCIDELNRGFSAAGGGEVRSSLGSSGNFFAQIRNGAPFDVLLSADMYYPRELAKAGLADGSTLMVYAHGKLMLWTADHKLDIDAGMALLRQASVTRIAIANPDVAPYGLAAKAALENAGLWEGVKSRLVYGENVAQTAQFVATGNAQVGFVGSAHVRHESGSPRGRAWPVPQALYPLLEQGGIVTARGRANPAAARYLAYLQSDAGRAILRKYGFSLPERPA